MFFDYDVTIRIMMQNWTYSLYYTRHGLDIAVIGGSCCELGIGHTCPNFQEGIFVHSKGVVVFTVIMIQN